MKGEKKGFCDKDFGISVVFIEKDREMGRNQRQRLT